MNTNVCAHIKTHPDNPPIPTLPVTVQKEDMYNPPDINGSSKLDIWLRKLVDAFCHQQGQTRSTDISHSLCSHMFTRHTYTLFSHCSYMALILYYISEKWCN